MRGDTAANGTVWCEVCGDGTGDTRYTLVRHHCYFNTVTPTVTATAVCSLGCLDVWLRRRLTPGAAS